MASRIRVVHAPARTPYVRKLTDGHIEIVNGTVHRGMEVPRDVSMRWLLERRPFDWFDVLHLHHVEFDDLATLKSVLSECARSGRRVVFTAHDVDPVFSKRAAYHRKLSVLAEAGVPFVCLTEASRSDVRKRFGDRVETVTIPHGFVVPPGTSYPSRAQEVRSPRYFLFGSLRENRDITTALYNWRFGRHQQDTSMHLLLRAPGRINLLEEHDRWSLLTSMAGDPRLRIDVLPHPTDEDVVDTALGCDALVLPYRWGSHSGQLELAFDLGLVPVVSAVGYVRDQYDRHAPFVDEPVWFDWSDGAEYAYGPRFLEALDTAAERLRHSRPSGPSPDFADYRITEHEAIMAAHLEMYTRACS
ncbi:hypothetical protein ACH4XT_17060 [Streptomyces avidinii]|uniref:hypothetical protein n=1 Tax=Streptomyces avidinii TaxID=1895 RepID=UPI0037BABF2A